MEIVAVDPNHTNCLITLFESAYDCFQNKEYCVLTLPSSIEVGCLTDYFTKVPPRYDEVLSHDLYVMHKNAILGNIKVKVRRENLEKLLFIYRK